MYITYYNHINGWNIVYSKKLTTIIVGSWENGNAISECEWLIPTNNWEC